MGQCGCVVGALTLPLHRGTTNTCCSRCYLSSAGESLVSHTEMLTFPFLCFPLLFPFPERDRTVSHCPVCGHWPPLVPAVPQPCHSHGSMHSTPPRPEERGGPCLARQVLSAQSCHSVGKLFDWKRCPRPLS